jgi:hypothetical protein
MWSEPEKEKIDSKEAASMPVEELINLYNKLVDEHNQLVRNYNWLQRTAATVLE